jgi:hypothetical protein
LPDNHPWQGSILQLQSHGVSNRKLALWYSVVHHLHLSSDDSKLKKYKIHHHHFSEIGWQQSSQKTTYIDKATAKRFDGIIHRKAYDDKVNLLKYILGKLGWRVEKADEGMYVEAPIVSSTMWQQEVCTNEPPLKEFLDKQKCNNFCTGTAGFLGYANALLSFPEGEAPESVLYLDSNESGLENLYSQL